MNHWPSLILMLAFGAFASGAAVAQNLLPNPGFEEGGDTPAGWRREGAGTWGEKPHGGGRAVSVQGNGDDQSQWRSDPFGVASGGLYRLRFHGRHEPGASGGTAVVGTGWISRDFGLSEAWQENGYVFAMPRGSTNEFLRLGQWHVRGTVWFDDVSLLPVMASHARLADGAELGEGESIHDGAYRFSARLGWDGANYHRVLHAQRAGFNSDRWIFSSGSEVVYRLGAGSRVQTGAQLRVAINHYISGTLKVDASRDGTNWQAITNFDGARRGGRFPLAPQLFPADRVFIRLSASPGSAFQVNTFDYEARLALAEPSGDGATRFLEVTRTSSELAVVWRALRRSERHDRWLLDFTLENPTSRLRGIRGSAWTDGESARGASRDVISLEKDGRCTLSVPIGSAGPQVVHARFEDADGRPLFEGRVALRVGLLDDRRAGYWLAESDQLGLWWCESGWKVGRGRGLPDRPGDGQPKPIELSAARGEYEAVQVVLRPNADGQLMGAKIGPWRATNGTDAAIETRIDEVAYVQVTHPTDATCERGWYPDPLPPLRTPLALRAGQNQPLWITFHIRRDAKAGAYRGEIDVETSWGRERIPVALHVYDFALPEETHLKSAFGLGTREISSYHKLSRREDRQAVFESYLTNFAEHRISPYSFYDFAPIDVRFVGEGTNKQARVDFTQFDRAAARWLDRFHFSTFQLPLRGMGGGTFHSRHLGALEGFQEGTPGHTRLFTDYLGQVERHLRERGWLSKAFTYWFDEPDPKDYGFVVAGMERIKAAAPGLRRMLTEQPEKELLGHVDIWCGLTPEWTLEKVRARRAAGEEVWWYICTGPKAPYVTEFIDHAGTELRLWPWQSWQYGVEGILVWASVYWNSTAAFPPPTLQDPWSDPMSYVSGYSFGPGHVGYWGNGDGRFLYPPQRTPDASTAPNLDPPVNSFRWENLRDGMEDYEYFWLLNRAIERARQTAGENELLREARLLLAVPPEVSRDLTHFTTDPRPLLQHRERVARMIERLQGTLR